MKKMIFFLFRVSALGCSHNGTMFANGSVVPSIEPCLNCKCISSHLVCSLRVCPEQPIPPPRGCVLVHKRSTCCSYLTCSKFHAEYRDEPKNHKVVTHDRKWYEANIRHRIYNQNALQRRIDDGLADSDQIHTLEINNEKSMYFLD